MHRDCTSHYELFNPLRLTSRKPEATMKGIESANYMPVPQTQSDDEEHNSWKSGSIKENGSTDILQKPLINEKLTDEDETQLDAEPMSLSRKFCFVLSLLLCVFFIVAFAWLIPCKLPQYLGKGNPQLLEWSLVLDINDIVLSTNLENVPGLANTQQVVVFGTISRLNATNSALMAIRASTGEVIWHVKLPSPLHLINCNQVDVNNDTILDCVVLGSELMIVVNGTDGHIFWELQAETFSNPIAIPDCDGDSIDEMVSFHLSSNISVVVLSGSSGITIISHSIETCSTLPEAAVIHRTEAKNITNFVFSCEDQHENGNIWSFSSSDLCHGRTPLKPNLIQVPETNQVGGTHLLVLSTKSEEEVVIVWNDASIFLISGEDYSTQWSFSISINSTIRAITSGSFFSSNLTDIALGINENEYCSKLLVLDASTGSIKWNQTFENGTITGLMTAPKLFYSRDGLLVKFIKPLSLSQMKSQDRQQFENYIEQYFVFDCTISDKVTSVFSEIVSQDCSGQDCSPDVYSPIKRATVINLNRDGTPDIVVASTSAIEKSNSLDKPFHQKTVLHLVDFSAHIQLLQ
ncbi:protein FAM234B-like isoform X2 [Tachypleus tridentatus]